MTCTSCSQSIENALQMVEGVRKAVVGLALEEAKVVYDPKLLDTNQIIEGLYPRNWIPEAMDEFEFA
ncbi:copper-transporting ATPase HMA5-like, partial [Trifolium medium]|nr:copper-transporting ATPase HMA5-like [Trifolium medium]